MKINNINQCSDGAYTSINLTMRLKCGKTFAIDVVNSYSDAIGIGEDCEFSLRDGDEVVCSEKCDTIEYLFNMLEDDEIFDVADQINFDCGSYNLAKIFSEKKKESLLKAILKPFGLFADKQNGEAISDLDYYDCDDYSFDDNDSDDETNFVIDQLKEKQKSLSITVKENLEQLIDNTDSIAEALLRIKKSDGIDSCTSAQEDIVDIIFGYQDRKKILEDFELFGEEGIKNLHSKKFIKNYSQDALQEIIELLKHKDFLPLEYTVIQKLNTDRKVDMEIIIG